MNKQELNYYEMFCEISDYGKLIMNNGLCGEIYFDINSIPEDRLEFIELFEPDANEKYELKCKGLSTSYWGSDLKVKMFNNDSDFGPTRQNLLLLMAAYKNQL